MAPGRSAPMGGRFPRWNGQERAPNREPSQGSTDEVRTSLSRVRFPGFEIEVEALREKPEIIAAASVPDTLDHLAEVIEGLDRAPIIMGHSFGGTFTQLLVNRGLGAAAVVIDSAPPEGVRVNPPSQIKSLFPVLKNPANRHRAVGFTKEQFHYAFTNTVSREESDAAYDLLHISAPGICQRPRGRRS